jgi:hypothetical protein
LLCIVYLERILVEPIIEVLITDKGIPFEQLPEFFSALDDWAKQYCGDGYVGYDVVDVSDFSGPYDEIGAYRFVDSKMAEWFLLAHKS